MAAPQYVPTAPTTTNHYSSPPQRAGGWSANRPGETFASSEAIGTAQGAQGPDQGFALNLVAVFDTKAVLLEGEHRADVDAGVVAVATKRASFFHRAPVVHDMRIAYTLFGFLDDAPAADLVDFRRSLFAEVHHAVHYFDRRTIADLVTQDVLIQSPDEVATRYRTNWRDQLGQ